MQNGSVQRAAKRSYMDEATVHALTEDVVKVAKITNTLAERLVVAEQRIVDERARALSHFNEAMEAIRTLGNELRVSHGALAGRVDEIGTFLQSVASAQVNAAVDTDAEPADPTTTPAA